MSKIKAEREELRKVGDKTVKVTVVKREPTPEEQLEQRLAVLEARMAALEKIVIKK